LSLKLVISVELIKIYYKIIFTMIEPINRFVLFSEILALNHMNRMTLWRE